VRVDDQCEFVTWLQGMPGAEQRKPEGATVRDLEGKSHWKAATTFAVALDGKMADAKRSMTSDGIFSAASSALTMAMMDWCQKSL
jgi:hypothetical protein